MNAPVLMAQLSGSPQASISPKNLKILKPQSGQSIAIHLDGKTKLDLSDIASEKLTFVRIGERLIILFDNQSTVTVDPVFDSLNRPIDDVTFGVSPDRILSGEEFASVFPLTTDQSVLPAAGTPGAPAIPAGANFGNAFIDPLATPNPLALLGPEELPTWRSEPRENGAPDYLPLQIAGARVLAFVEEEELRQLTEGSTAGRGNEDSSDPGVPNPDTSGDYSRVNLIAKGSLASLVGGGNPPLGFAVFAGADGAAVLDDSGNVLRSLGSAVRFDVTSSSTVEGRSEDNRLIFTLTIETDGSFTFELTDQIDHPTLNGQIGDNLENLLGINLTGLIQVSDANGSVLVLSGDAFVLNVSDDIPVVGSTAVVVDEDDLDAKDSASQGNDDQQLGDIDAVGAPSIDGRLNFSLGSDAYPSSEVPPKIVSFAAMDGQAVVGRFDDGRSGQVTSQGHALHYVWDADSSTLYAVWENDKKSDAGSAQNAVFKLEITNQLTGEFTFTLLDQVDHPLHMLMPPPPPFETAAVSDIPVQGGGAYEDNINLDLSYTVTDFDGDTVNGVVSITINDDVPVLAAERAIHAIADEDDISTEASRGTSPNDGNSDGSYTGDSAINDDGPATVTGDLSALVKVGADEPVTFGFAGNASNVLGNLDLTSHGDQLFYVVEDGVLTAYAASGAAKITISDGQGDGADGRVVFTLEVNSEGTFKFQLFDQLDHAPVAGDNTDLASGEGSIPALNFGGIILATDADGDSVALDRVFDITIRDDVPQLIRNAKVSATVDEDDIDTRLSLGTSPNDGNADGSYTGNAGENLPGAATVSGTLTSLIAPGADEKLTFGFTSEAVVKLEQLGLTSQGDALSYSINGGVLAATADGRTVFVLSVGSDGKYKFELNDQLDHDRPNSGADQNYDLQDTVAGDVTSINFGGLIKAVDYDGDAVTLDGKFEIRVRDDIPVVKSGPGLSLIVDEDDIATNLSQGTSPNDGNADGSYTGDAGNNNPGPATVSGSVASLVSAGADEQLTFSFTGNAASTLGSLGLSSQGRSLSYTVQNGVLIGYVDQGQGGYQSNSDRTVFKLTLTGNGDFKLQLFDQLDHDRPYDDFGDRAGSGDLTPPAGNADQNFDLQDNVSGDLTAIDFGRVIQATDFDGDTVTLNGKVTIAIRDDIPQLVRNASVGGVVEEEQLPGGNDDFLPDPIDADQNIPSSNQDYNQTTNIVSGTGANGLGALIATGADESGKFEVRADIRNAVITDANGHTVTSSGANVVVSNVSEGTDSGGRYDLITAQAGGNVVFTLKVYETGNWTFELKDQLDHTNGDNIEGTLALDLSGLVKFTDFDGDSVNLSGGSFKVTVIDDVPIANLSPGYDADLRLDETKAGSPQDTWADPDANDERGVANPFSAYGQLIGYAEGGRGDLFNASISVGADAPGSKAYSLQLSFAPGASTGLQDSQTNADILLKQVNGDVVGYFMDGGTERVSFVIRTDANDGDVRVYQYRAIEHNNPNDADEHGWFGTSQPEALNSGLVYLKLTVTDRDGDQAVDRIDIGRVVRFEDDGPVVLSGSFDRLIDEEDIQTTWSDGTANGSGPAFIQGSLASYVDFGTDGQASGGGFSIAADRINAELASLGLRSQGTELGYSVSHSGGFDVLTASANGHAVFELKLNKSSGAYEFRLFDQIDHDPPNELVDGVGIGAGADKNTDLQDGLMFSDVSAIDFGDVIRVTDSDGDSVLMNGKLTISIRDDIPEAHINAVAGATLIHDETPGNDSDADDTSFEQLSASAQAAFNALQTSGDVGDDPDVSGSGAIGYATDTLVSLAGTKVGADEPATVAVTLELNGSRGMDSGLVATDGTRISLYSQNGLIVGRLDHNGDGRIGPSDKVAFAIHIDSTGKVSVAQYLSIRHDDKGDSDEANDNGSNSNDAAPDDSPNPVQQSLGDKIRAVVTVTDRDGDTVSDSVSIGHLILFQDDGPQVTVTASASADALVVDETALGTDATANFANNFSSVPNYGADGTGSVTSSYALSISESGAASGIIDVATGNQVNLYLNGGAVEGRAGGLSGALVFKVTVDGSGEVTLDQLRAVKHPDGTNPDDAVQLSAADLIKLTRTDTITDGDGDSASGSASINIGKALSFEDDDPHVTITANNVLLVVDESVGTDGSVQNEGGQPNNDETASGVPGAIGFARLAGTALFSETVTAGSDGLNSKSYALLLNNNDTGLVDTAMNSAVTLSKQGNVIIGSSAGQKVFTIEVDAVSGEVKVTQFRAIKHDDSADHDENGAAAEELGSGKIQLQVKVTDGDGDSAQSSFDLGSLIRFEDDGPAVASVTAANSAANGLFLDGFTSNSPQWGVGSGVATGTAGDWTIERSTVGGATSPKLERVGDGYQGADSPTNSVMVDMEASPGNVQISQNLILTSGETYRITFEAGKASGTASDTAKLEVWFGGAQLGTIQASSGVMQTYSFEVVGSGAPQQLLFKEVGQNGDKTGTYLANVKVLDVIVVDETKGIQPDSDERNDISAMFAAVSNQGTDADMPAQYAQGSASIVAIGAIDHGSDGPAAVGAKQITIAASSNGVDSGLKTTDGHAIFLFNESNADGSFVIGRFDSDGNSVADKAAFAFKVDAATGILSIAQFVSLSHPVTTNPDEGVYLNSGTLLAKVTVTDGDGDTATKSADVSAMVRFEDDGPTAENYTGATFVEGSGAHIIGAATTVLGISAGADGLQGDLSSIVFSNQGSTGGTLSIDGSGNLIYTAPSHVTSGPDVTETFSYTVTDRDGDAVTRQVTFGVSDTGISDVIATSAVVDEDDIVGGGGNAGGPGDVTTPVPTGHISYTLGADALASVELLATPVLNKLDGTAVHAVWEASTNTLTGYGSGTSDVVFTIALSNVTSSGADYTVTLLQPVKHPGQNEDDLDFTVDVKVTDADGSVGTTSFQVTVDDDSPVIDTGAGDLIENGSFEALGGAQVPSGQWELLNTIPGWTKGDNVPFEVQVGNIGGVPPQDGNVKIELDGDRSGNSSVSGGAAPDPVHSHATIEQTVTTAVGQNYELNFYYAARPDAGAGSSGLEVLWNGQVVYTIDPDTSTGWQKISLAVIANSTSSVLAFRAAGPANEENTLGAFIDNVKLTAVATVDEDGLPSGVGDSQPGDANVANGDSDGKESTATGTLNIKWGADALDNPDAANTNTSFVQDNVGRSLTFSNASVAVGGVAVLSSHGEAVNQFVLSNNNSILTAKTATGRPVFEVSLSDDGSGAFRFVLLDHLDHAPGQAENDLLLSFNYTATDADGDAVTGRFSVAVDDDMPVARDDSASQSAENQAFTIAVFGNDVFGADGVDTDNSPAAKVTFTQPAQGVVTYDGTTGLFTYTPSSTAGSSSTTDTFTYTIEDGDGDKSTATVSLTLKPDSEPTVSVTDGTVDEKGLSNGSASAGSSETTTGSFTIATGNDTLGSLEVKNADGDWVDVTSAITGSPVTVAGANGVLTVTSDGAGHYSWSYTLTQNLLSHDDTVVDGDGDRGAADQKPGEAFLVRATDHEGDVSTDTLTITVNDDGPTASNDSASQSAENQAFTIAVFGNDVFGADGVDTDNSPAAKVTFTQPAQGVVTYDGTTGLFTYTPSSTAGSSSTTDTFTYTIEDGDGDKSTATVSLTLKPDSEPAVSVTDGTVVDEDDIVGGGGNAGGPGDVTTPVPTGHISYTLGADALSSVTLSSTPGLSKLDGTPVHAAWDAATNTLTGYGSSTSDVVFTIALSNVTSSGADYTVTLLQPVKHPGQNEDDLDFTVEVKVTDADGSVGNGSFQVTVDDDTPTMGTITNGSIATNETNSISGTISTNFGADGAQAVPYKFTGTQSVGNGLTGTVSENDTLLTVKSGADTIYTVKLNANGSYDFNMLKPLPQTTQAITAIGREDFSNGSAVAAIAFAASGVTFVQVPGGGLLDPFNPTGVSNGGFGVGDEQIRNGESFGINFDSMMASTTLSMFVDSVTSGSPDTVTVKWTVKNSATGVTETGSTTYTDVVGELRDLLIDPVLPKFDSVTIDVTTPGGARYIQVTGLSGKKWVDPVDQTLTFNVSGYDSDGDAATGSFSVALVTPKAVVGSAASDVVGSTEDHVVPGGEVEGVINGSTGPDTIVGDPGGIIITPGQTANICLVLDTSGSMGDERISFGGSTITRQQALENAVNSLLTTLAGSGAQAVRVHIIEFFDTARVVGTYDLISGGVADQNVLTDAKSDVTALRAGGGTNYEYGLYLAHQWVSGATATDPLANANVNKLLFISDGEPNYYMYGDHGDIASGGTNSAMAHVLGTYDGWGELFGDPDDNTNEPALIESVPGWSIEAIGINVSATNLALLSNIEDGNANGGDGSATNVTSAEQLANAVQVLGSSTDLAAAGNDTINGGGGNDIIFGDVPFTDALADAQGVNLPDGSGWAVFQQLEASGSLPAWSRADTLDYIAANHQALAKESGRSGGADTIHGDDGNDIIYGQEGNDSIFGDAGNDVLVGGTGSDTLSGGAGQDTFKWLAGDLKAGAVDTILDFESGSTGDVLDLQGLLAGLGYAEGSRTSHVRFQYADNSTQKANEVDTPPAVDGNVRVQVETGVNVWADVAILRDNTGNLTGGNDPIKLLIDSAQQTINV